jgi:hypothetical protein
MSVNSDRSIKRWATVFVTTAQANATTTFQAINSLIISNLSAWVYMINATISYSTAALTTWIWLTVWWTSISASYIWLEWPSTTTATLTRVWTNAAAPAVFTWTPYTADNIVKIQWKVTLSASGNINIQFRSEVGWSAINILPWSMMEIRKIT